MKKLIYISFLVGIFSACSNPKPINNAGNDSAVANTTFLADTHFAYKNITDTYPLWKKHKYGENDTLYSDSTRKISFIELTQAQKEKFIAPFIMRELDIKDLKFVGQYMNVHFISKQQKIGDIQPILVMIRGDDYQSLTMILFDKNLNPVDGFNVCGGFDSGPYVHGDTSMIYPDNRYSTINNDKITTYRITEKHFDDSLKMPTVVDSVVLQSLIRTTGKITTKTIGYRRYTLPYKNE